MTTCHLLKHLQDRTKELIEKFLEDEIQKENNDPINYQPDLDLQAAFRLLFHAELEDFLEEKAAKNLASIIAKQPLNTSQRNSPELLSILYIIGRQIPVFDMQKTAVFGTLLKEIVLSAQSQLKDNNGIKSESFTKLSVFAGKTLEEIDQSLLAALNSYGKKRGDVAHRSVMRVSTLSGASTEKSTAENIVKELSQYFA